MKVKSAFQFQSETRIQGKGTQKEVEMWSYPQAESRSSCHGSPKLILLLTYDYLMNVRPPRYCLVRIHSEKNIATAVKVSIEKIRETSTQKEKQPCITSF